MVASSKFSIFRMILRLLWLAAVASAELPKAHNQNKSHVRNQLPCDDLTFGTGISEGWTLFWSKHDGAEDHVRHWYC